MLVTFEVARHLPRPAVANTPQIQIPEQERWGLSRHVSKQAQNTSQGKSTDGQVIYKYAPRLYQDSQLVSEKSLSVRVSK